MTECTQETFGFTAHFSRRVQAEFTAGQVSSDGGVLLLREVDRRIKVISAQRLEKVKLELAKAFRTKTRQIRSVFAL